MMVVFSSVQLLLQACTIVNVHWCICSDALTHAAILPGVKAGLVHAKPSNLFWLVVLFLIMRYFYFYLYLHASTPLRYLLFSSTSSSSD